MTGSIATAQTIAEAHAKLRSHGEIQFDLPSPAPPPEPPAWLRWLLEHLRFGGQGLNWLFWGLVVLIVALLLFFLIRWAVQLEWRKPAAAAEDEVAAWRPEEKAARALLAEAEAMAAAGNFAEAVHLLLHRSIEDISKRRPSLLRPALTSREIARIAALPEIVRATFARMAAPVERSLFGGRALARPAWEEARDAYHEFALPASWK